MTCVSATAPRPSARSPSRLTALPVCPCWPSSTSWLPSFRPTVSVAATQPATTGTFSSCAPVPRTGLGPSPAPEPGPAGRLLGRRGLHARCLARVHNLHRPPFGLTRRRRRHECHMIIMADGNHDTLYLRYGRVHIWRFGGIDMSHEKTMFVGLFGLFGCFFSFLLFFLSSGYFRIFSFFGLGR